LIAVGASVTANCQPCLDFHVGKAREYGAGEKDIAMAVAVGKTVRKGAAAILFGTELAVILVLYRWGVGCHTNSRRTLLALAVLIAHTVSHGRET